MQNQVTNSVKPRLKGAGRKFLPCLVILISISADLFSQSRTDSLLINEFPDYAIYTGMPYMQPIYSLNEHLLTFPGSLQPVLHSKTNTLRNIVIRLIVRKTTDIYRDLDAARNMEDIITFENIIIRNILIREINIFAATIYDTSHVSVSWLEKSAYSLHSGTRNSVIKRNLLVSEGEKVNVLDLEENERIIRDLPYIMDARFLVKQIPGCADSVDLVLLIKDLWPVAFGAEMTDVNSGNAGLWNVNLLGFGHQLRVNAYWDTDKAPWTGYNISHGIPNIYGTFVKSRLSYTRKWDTDSWAASLSRDFSTTELKYAGAALFERTNTVLNINLTDTSLLNIQTNYINSDIWVGRLFPLYSNTHTGLNSQMFVAARAYKLNYSEGPETSENFLYRYQSKEQILLTLAYSMQGFRRDNLIYSIDRTEDVPYGFLIELTGGMERGQYANRPYIGTKIYAGRYIGPLGYFNAGFQYGTFLKKNNIEQSIIDARLRYFSNLLFIGQSHMRWFLSFNYQKLIKPYEGTFLSLENRYGIEGLNGESMRGDEKIFISLESTLFSPIKLLGFHFNFFALADMGVVRNSISAYTANDFYSGIGAGIRIRNDLLVFDALEIKFTFYPNKPPDSDLINIEGGAIPRLGMQNFFPRKPSVLEN